jgi:hypothetical protein
MPDVAFAADRRRVRFDFARLTLRGLAERGIKGSYRTVWTFVHREKVSYKSAINKAYFRPSKIAPAWPPTGRAGKDAIRAAGAKRIFLPAYSPDLNPPPATPPSSASRSLWLAPPIDPSAGSGGLRQAETFHAKSQRENHRSTSLNLSGSFSIM